MTTRTHRWIGVVGGLASMAALGLGAWQVAVPGPSPVLAASTEDQRWLNRRTGVYHRLGCRWFDATADGVILSIKEAEKAGLPCGLCIGRAPRRPRGTPVRAKRAAEVYILE